MIRNAAGSLDFSEHRYPQVAATMGAIILGRMLVGWRARATYDPRRRADESSRRSNRGGKKIIPPTNPDCARVSPLCMFGVHLSSIGNRGAGMFDFFRSEPLYHYPMDRFSLKSPILYRTEHRVIHVGGGPNRNHPREINVNLLPLSNVDIVANAERLPFGNATIDVVISNAVLEHVRNLEATVAEIERVLKPGGFVYVEIPFMQHYHTHDSHGVRFEDYRRLTKTGLTDALSFCTPLDVGVCVGPTSTVCQIFFSFLRDLSTRRWHHRLIDRLYHFFGNLVVWMDACLSRETIERSRIPSGIYFFGRKRDAKTQALDRLPQPNSQFARDVSAEITLREQTSKQIEFRVRNTSHTTWLKESLLDWGTVRVGLGRGSDGRLERNFKRLDLPRDTGPGDSFHAIVDLAEFNRADAVMIDLVIEGVCWFAERGSRPLVVRLPRAG